MADMTGYSTPEWAVDPYGGSIDNRQPVGTFTANIYISLRAGYDGPTAPLSAVEEVCQAYVNRGGMCVTVTPTRFIYTNGSEDGAIVGLINYPRFPSTPEAIRATALELAAELRTALGQHRASVVFPDITVMLQG